MPPTHRVRIEEYALTGNVIDDGMGGGTPERDWVPVATNVPARYMPAGTGLVREEHGDRVRDAPSVVIQARYLGRLTDDQEYELIVGTGDNWRVDIGGLRGENRRKSIVNISESYGRRRVPDTIHLETELLE